jgi:hypothetical protein
MYANAEAFLAEFLGGRLEQHKGKIAGSSIQIKEGAEILKALKK